MLFPEVSEEHVPGIQEDHCSREHAALQGERNNKTTPKLDLVCETHVTNHHKNHMNCSFNNSLLLNRASANEARYSS